MLKKKIYCEFFSVGGSIAENMRVCANWMDDHLDYCILDVSICEITDEITVYYRKPKETKLRKLPKNKPVKTPDDFTPLDIDDIRGALGMKQFCGCDKNS